MLNNMERFTIHCIDRQFRHRSNIAAPVQVALVRLRVLLPIPSVAGGLSVFLVVGPPAFFGRPGFFFSPFVSAAGAGAGSPFSTLAVSSVFCFFASGAFEPSAAGLSVSVGAAVESCSRFSPDFSFCSGLSSVGLASPVGFFSDSCS